MCIQQHQIWIKQTIFLEINFFKKIRQSFDKIDEIYFFLDKTATLNQYIDLFLFPFQTNFKIETAFDFTKKTAFNKVQIAFNKYRPSHRKYITYFKE